MKKQSWSRERCKCGRKAMKGTKRCHACHREDVRNWWLRRGGVPSVNERGKLMARYRRRGMLPKGGRCPCGRKGMVHLRDMLDVTSVYWMCRRCERRVWWARRRGEEWVQPVESEARRRAREAWGERRRRMIEGNRERLKDPEYRAAMVARLAEGRRKARERRELEARKSGEDGVSGE